MTTINHQIIDYSPGNKIARVAVSNAKRLNILNQAAMEALRDTINSVAQDDAIRMIVLTGAGERAFIGGADIREMVQLDPDSAEHFITTLHQACDAIRQAPVPVIARIAGYCLGAGLEVAAACDMRVAADNAVFGMPEVRVGLPSVIEAALLPRLIGWGRTSRLLYSGETISAQQALAWGLVEEVVSLDDLDTATDALSNAIVNAGPKAIRAQKALLRQWETLPLAEAIEQGIVSFRQTYHSDEPQVMMQRFLDRKRD